MNKMRIIYERLTDLKCVLNHANTLDKRTQQFIFMRLSYFGIFRNINFSMELKNG